MTPGFKDRDPAQSGFQFLEDLSTAYWYSQVLFTAIELNLFDYLEQGPGEVEHLAHAAQCNARELSRLLNAMERIGLVACHRDLYCNNPAASRFLVPGRPDYMGDFFLYRRYMRPQWDALTRKLTGREPEPEPDLPYSQRLSNYTAAMDTLVRQKAAQILALLKSEPVSGAILDIGGGAGSLARALKRLPGAAGACVFDLPEVIEAARELYPGPENWEGVETLGGDFRTHAFDRTFSLVCMSNFLHAYGEEEAHELLLKAVSLVNPGGLVLIHDYFPDRMGAVPQKGPLYDLNMMANTYNGVCHDSRCLVDWLAGAGFASAAVTDLETDTSVILARQQGSLPVSGNLIEAFAWELGFADIAAIDPKDVVTVPWAREKCRYGCGKFNKGLQCPPYGMDDLQTRRLLDAYSTAYLVRGTPPGRSFHNLLLSLEKKAFLQGYHKAFVFGAGPCTVCKDCPEDGSCRYPQLARPSMEGSGIDVYTTALNAGINLKPVKEKGEYVTYIGLVLVE